MISMESEYGGSDEIVGNKCVQNAQKLMIHVCAPKFPCVSFLANTHFHGNCQSEPPL